MTSSSSCGTGMNRVLLLLAFIAFCLNGAGVGNPYWLEKEYKVRAAPPAQLTPMLAMLNMTLVFEVEVESTIGLVWACTDATVIIPLGLPGVPEQETQHECKSLPDIDTDLVEDWQWIAAGLGVVGLINSFIALLLTVAVQCNSGQSKGLRIGIVLCYVIACGGIVTSLVLFEENRDVKINHQPLIRQEYGREWGYYVAAGSAGLSFILVLLNAATACCAPSNRESYIH